MSSPPRSSSFIGVTKHHSGTYRVELPASTMVNEAAQFVGFFTSEEKAAKAYDRALLLRLQKHDKLPSSGPPASPLNFPNDAELPEDGHDEVCSHCSEGGELLLCENPGCDRVWHFECLYPPLKEAPQEEDPWFCALCIFDRAKAAIAAKASTQTEGATSSSSSSSRGVVLADCPHSDCKATGISDRTVLVLHMQRRCTQIARLLGPASSSSSDVIGDTTYAKKPVTARQKAKADGSKQLQQQQEQQPSESSTGLRAKWGKRGRPPFWAYSKMAQEETEKATLSANGGPPPKISALGLDGEGGIVQAAPRKISTALSDAARRKIKNLKRAREREIEREKRLRQQLLDGPEDNDVEGDASVQSASSKKRPSIKKRDHSSSRNTRGSPRGEEDKVNGECEASSALTKNDATGGVELGVSGGGGGGGGGGMAYFNLARPHSPAFSDTSSADEMDMDIEGGELSSPTKRIKGTRSGFFSTDSDEIRLERERYKVQKSNEKKSLRRFEDDFLSSFGLVSTQPIISSSLATLDTERGEMAVEGTSPKLVSTPDQSPSRKRNRLALSASTRTEKLPDTVVPMPVVPLLPIFDKDAVFLHSIAYIAKLPSLYPALISTNSNSDDVNQDSSMNVNKSKDEKGEMNDLNQPSSNFDSSSGDNFYGNENESESLSEQLMQSLVEALSGSTRPSTPILAQSLHGSSNQTSSVLSQHRLSSIFYNLELPMRRLVTTIFLHALAKHEAREDLLSKKHANGEKMPSSSSSSSPSSSSPSTYKRRILTRKDALHTETVIFSAIAAALSPRGALAVAGFTRSLSEHPFSPMVHPASIGSASNLTFSAAVPIGAPASQRAMSDVAATFLVSQRQLDVAQSVTSHVKARPQTSLYDGHYFAQPSVHASDNGNISVGFLPSSSTAAEPTFGGPMLLRDRLAQVMRSRASLAQQSCLNSGVGLGIITIEEGGVEEPSDMALSSASAEGSAVSSANATGSGQGTGGGEKGEMFRSSPFRFGPGAQSANINQPPVLSAGTSGGSPSTYRAGGSGMMRDLNTVRERIVNELDLKRRQAMLRSWGKSLAILKLLAQPVIKAGADKNLSAIDAIAVMGETPCREGLSLQPNVVSAAYFLRQPSSISIDVTMFLDKEAIFDSSASTIDESLLDPIPEPFEFEAHHNSSGGIKVSSVESEREVPALPTFTIVRGTPKTTDSDITEAASILRAFISAEDAADIPSARSVTFLRRAISGADASQLTFLQGLVAPVDFDFNLKASSTLEHKLRAKGVAARSTLPIEESAHLLRGIEEKPLPGGALEDEVDEPTSVMYSPPETKQLDEASSAPPVDDGIVSL